MKNHVPFIICFFLIFIVIYIGSCNKNYPIVNESSEIVSGNWTDTFIVETTNRITAVTKTTKTKIIEDSSQKVILDRLENAYFLKISVNEDSTVYIDNYFTTLESDALFASSHIPDGHCLILTCIHKKIENQAYDDSWEPEENGHIISFKIAEIAQDPQ